MDRLRKIENKLNNRPRKRYMFENPILVLKKLLFNLKFEF